MTRPSAPVYTFRGRPGTAPAPGSRTGFLQPFCSARSGTPYPRLICLPCPAYTGPGSGGPASLSVCLLRVVHPPPGELYADQSCRLKLPTSQPLPRGAYGCRPIRRSAIAAGTRLPPRILGGPPSWARFPPQAALNSSSVPRAPRCVPVTQKGCSFGYSTSGQPDHQYPTDLPAGGLPDRVLDVRWVIGRSIACSLVERWGGSIRRES